MVGDPISDLIIRIKNAGMVGKGEVLVPYSKLRHAVVSKLKENGFIADVETRGKKVRKSLAISLKYNEGAHVVSGVKRISKPGRRLYIKAANIHPVKFGKGKRILSTPQGVLTGEEAREQNVGGEELFIIW